MNSQSFAENSRFTLQEETIVATCLPSIADKDIDYVNETESCNSPSGCSSSGTGHKTNASYKNMIGTTNNTTQSGIVPVSSSPSSSSSSCVSPSFSNNNLEEHSKSSDRRESTKSHKTFNSRSDNKSSRDDERKAQAGNKKYPSKSFSDDTRLSRLMRRLLKENERDRRLNAAKQLKDYLRSPDGVKAAGKVTEEMLSTLQDLFYDRIFKEIKSEVAMCIGIIGSIMGLNGDRYFQWLFAQINSAPDDDIRHFFLLALLETLKCDEKKQTLADFMQNVMANIQTLLENADSAEILIAVVDVIQQLSMGYPLVFNSHFRDTVDILVGWHIDLTQKESLTQYTSEALISFHQFWIRDLNFSITLLGQFLEDMEAYADDLLIQVNSESMTEQEVPAAAECNTKISALLKVFTTVVKSLGDSFSPNKGPTISKEYISDVLEKIIRSVEHAGRYVFSERVRIVANNCLTLLLNQLQTNLIHNMDSLLPYITTQVNTGHLVSDQFVLSLLNIIQKIVEYINFNLPVNFITTLLGPDSLLLAARASHNEEILIQLMAVYNGVMSLKNVPLLEEAYRIVVGDIETAYNRLLKECKEEAITIVSSNLFENQEYTIKQAETVLIFNLSALAEIYNTKNNLIVMWALTPSIFDLLIKYLNPLNIAIAERFPAVQYATIHSLYSHSTRHSNFISSSNLLTQNTALEGSVLAGVSPATCEHFSAILGLLVDILSLNIVTYDCKCLCLKWCSEIANTLQTSQHVYLTNEFGELLKALIWLGYDREHQICLSACQCLHNVLKSSPSISDGILIRCIELCIYRLSDHHKNIKDTFSSLLKAIPLNLTASLSTLVSLEDGLQTKNNCKVRGLKAAWFARRQHICRSQPGNFHAHNFRQMMAYILQNNTPSTFGSLNWLESMFYCAQRQDKEDKKDDAMSLCTLVNGNYALLWFWSTWEAAQFCVLSRLRTPLGKPQDTFTTIESVIKSYAAEIRFKGDLEDGLKTYDHKKEKNADYNASVRVHLLLQFMEHLEKQLYNAYEGCAVAMVAAPKPVRTFFRTNKGTCQEWLNRIRTHIMLIALHCGMPSMVIRQASELLWELKENNNTQGSEFEHIIMYMVQALVDLKCPEAVQGIYNWCKDVIGRKLPWIKAMIEKACGRYETAAKECKLFLRTSFSKETDERKGDSRCASPESTTRSTGEEFTRKVILTKFPEPDRLLVHFVSNEITDCYMKLSDWESALEWQDTMQAYRSDSSLGPINKAFSSAVDINYIKSLNYFDSGNYTGVRESMELIPGMSLSESVLSCQLPLGLLWSPKQSLEHAHKQFIRIVTLLQEQNKSNTCKNDMSKCLDQCERLLENVLIVQSLQWPTFLPSEYVTELDIVAALKKQLDDKRGKMALVALSEKLVLDEADQDVSTYLQVMRLLNLQYQLLPGHDKRSDLNTQMTRLHLSTASLARKQHNHQLAERLLHQHMKSLLKNPENGKISTQEGVLPALTSLHTNNCNGLSALDILKVEREYAKLLHSIGQHKEGLDVVSSSIVHFHEWGGDSSNNNTNGIEGGGAVLSALQKIKDKAQQGQCNELCARSLLTLVKWLQLDHKILSNISSQLKNCMPSHESTSNGISVKNIKMLLEMKANMTNNGFELSLVSESQDKKGLLNGCPFMSDSDAIIGHLLHLSAMKSPSLAKAWFALASWCYKWGRKAVDNASHGSVELLEEEKMQITNLLPQEAEIDKVMNVLSKIHTPISSEEDISDQDQSLYDDGAETTRKQLVSTCISLQLVSEECIDGLMDVWKGVVQRVYHYYELSVKSYFKYLQLNAGAKNEENNEDVNIIATLRLLRLLVKHAWELRGVLETGLAETPTAPWKGIIPQLFSRLSHPESYVRQSVSELLCRVAEDAPHLIVYPAVVGCSVIKIDAKESNRDGFLNNYLIQNEEDCSEAVIVAEHDSQEPADEQDDGNNLTDDPTNTIMQICLTAIVDTLSHHNSEMIQQVQQIVQELRRITLLWDELWLGTLNQHHQDVTRRLAQLDNEIKKVGANKTLSKEEKVAIIREKHKTIMKPTLYTMERLVDVTSQAAETPHEQWFQTTYEQTITEALNRLKNPSNPGNPHTSWQLFKQLHHSLQQRAQKRNSLLLRMDEISPKLSSMHKSEIPMPGLTIAGKIVTIHSMSLTVQILPTKTKPKKLVFIGTDGKKYPYLFKGLEDLHLDERIMQFLNIVNSMFSNVNRGHQAMYRARHYSVTPLGPRSGLIQWVDGATPLFSLYKKWQQREMIAHSLKPTSSPVAGTTNVGSLSTTNPVMQRPSDIYYNKLTPALKEKGIINLENRKEWPLNVLKKVLDELMSETPKDLVAKELWCASTGPSEWWHKTQTYSRSTAVMSMIGYIIGLGDRHLDNVLVDLSTGEVVHIDYNVCFEKGKGLRVPEKVPFRMTQNIETALGVTGIEGTFRTASEHVIKTMRKGRETLLTLLEAFVYDPLVDWTTGNEGGYTGAFYGGGPTALTNLNEGRQSKRDMERDITISMFAIRVAEMKASWLKNKEDMLSALPLLENIMQDWAQQTDEFQIWETKLGNLENLHSMLSEALIDSQHTLYSLSERYSDYAVVKTTRDAVQATIQEKISDFGQWHANHKLVLQNVQGPVFQKMFAEVTKPLQFGAPSFSAATNFLQAAGQGQIVQQCEQLENELVTYLQNQRSVLRSALDILHTYATIIAHFGPNFAEKSRTSHYLNWLQRLLSELTSDKCSEIVDEFDEMYRKMCTNSVTAQPVLNIELKLQTIINTTNTRLIKLMDRRSLEATDTPQLEILMEQAICLIKDFIEENKEEGTKSLTAVIMTALCSLNKRYLLMESAADAAGDRLMDLTSRDGDWFLDELCSMSGNVTQLLEILVQNSMGTEMTICHLHTALTATHKVYIALHELNVNFRNIIIPEALKTIQAGEESVNTALKSLYQMISNLSCSLDQVGNQLEILHRNIVMGIENNNTDVQNSVLKLQNQFNDLLKISDSEPSDLSPGQMLLMAFNGLFIKLETEFSGLMDSVELIDVADNWKNVDLIKEAKSYQLSSFTSDTQGLMSSYFFVKRLQAMQDFFQMCQQFSSVLESSSGSFCFDDEQLAKPIKKFIADYVRKQVIGFPSQILGYIICVYIDSMGLDVSAEIELKDVGAESKVPLDDMCKKAVDACLKNGLFKHAQFTQASSLTSSQESTWRKHDLARRLDDNIVLIKGSLQRVQFQLARYQWLHEDIFTNARGHHNQMVMPNRASIMSEMRKSMSSLLTQENNFICCMERYNQLESSITQRLRWAAGANPSLNLVLTQFEEESTGRKTLCEMESKLASDVTSMCQGILHFEAFRTRTPEALTSDSNFMNLINRCRESCVLAESTASTVTDLEEELMTTKPPIEGEPVDQNYIKSTRETVLDEIKEVKSKYSRLKSSLDVTKELLTHQVVKIKSIVTTHHKLMSDIRTILKSVAKLEEQDHGFTPQPGSIRDYLSTYKIFSENLTAALKLAVNENVSKADMVEAENMIASLKDQTSGIYNKLVSFAPPLLAEKDNEDDENVPMNFVSGVGGSKKMERVSRDPRTGKAIQERNSYAVSVWRRVKMKLDGRDPDPNKRLTIQEQVDYVLKEATNLDNLAVLYEGWTPWV